MPTLTNEEILDANEALLHLGVKVLPVSVALPVARATREIEGYVRDILTVRDSLLQRYAKKDAEGNLVFEGETRIQLTEEGRREFSPAWQQLLSTPVDVSCALPTSQLEQVGEIEPNCLRGLLPLLAE